MPELSVLLCTRNPHPGRLSRTLAGLAQQNLAVSTWELLLIDNGSEPRLTAASLSGYAAANLRVFQESRDGLTRARLRGISAARGDVLVFVDDDNVLAPTFLSGVVAAFRASPGLGAAGGPLHPEFEIAPPAWSTPFHGLLALHDYGPVPLLARGTPNSPWPYFAPVGAGLCLRRSAALAYAELARSDALRAGLDRRGAALTSGGDSDMVFSTLHAGWDVAYFPELSLTHLIPAARLQPAYLARLNRAIQRSWVRVLSLHNQCPWPAISRWTVPLRAARAWFRHTAWRGPAARVGFAGLLGRFEGQADLA